MFDGQISYKFLLLVSRKDLKELEEGLENVKNNGGKVEITLKKIYTSFSVLNECFSTLQETQASVHFLRPRLNIISWSPY